MADVLKKFGRYFLLDHIAQGGMAEIYRARLASVDGAGRLIVIKRIQAGYGNNTEFLQMFRSEIKVTMGFNHPNIVQLYDFGEEQGQPYIAMEMVDGKNLRQFMNRFNEVKKKFPVELAAYIIENAAAGLHYAHTFKDKISGHHLSIVHRDVSPQNILIAFEGTIKVIDFGIAKANTNSESTRAGVIKGKPSYLSPEQISGEPLDGRSDVFALGIVLWELLVGRKLFAGDNDLAVLKLIESSQTYVKPPSTYNPAVPKELDYIVLKALAKQVDKRYQTAEELQRALHKFVYSFSPEFNPTDLSYAAKDLFKNEIVEDRKKIQSLNEEVEKLLITSELVIHQTKRIFESDIKEAAPADRLDHTQHTNTLANTLANTQSDMKRGIVAPVELPVVPSAPPVTFVAEISKAAEVEVSSPIAKPPKERVSPEKRSALIRGTNTGIQEPKPEAAKKNFLNSAMYVAAAIGLVAFLGPGFGIEVPYLSALLNARGRSLDSVNPIKMKPYDAPQVDPSRKSVLVRLNISPPGNSTTATINGKSVNLSNPVISVPVDAPLELIVQNPMFKTVERQFVVDSAQLGGQSEWPLDIQMEPNSAGYLSIKTTPSADATIMIDGKAWKKRTPFEKETLPVGKYTVKLTNDLLEMERTITVEVKQGEVTQPYDPDRELARELKLNMSSNRAPGSTKN
jgi:serine/threonine-protein kinase